MTVKSDKLWNYEGVTCPYSATSGPLLQGSLSIWPVRFTSLQRRVLNQVSKSNTVNLWCDVQQILTWNYSTGMQLLEPVQSGVCVHRLIDEHLSHLWSLSIKPHNIVSVWSMVSSPCHLRHNLINSFCNTPPGLNKAPISHWQNSIFLSQKRLDDASENMFDKTSRGLKSVNFDCWPERKAFTTDEENLSFNESPVGDRQKWSNSFFTKPLPHENGQSSNFAHATCFRYLWAIARARRRQLNIHYLWHERSKHERKMNFSAWVVQTHWVIHNVREQGVHRTARRLLRDENPFEAESLSRTKRSKYASTSKEQRPQKDIKLGLEMLKHVSSRRSNLLPHQHCYYSFQHFNETNPPCKQDKYIFYWPSPWLLTRQGSGLVPRSHNTDVTQHTCKSDLLATDISTAFVWTWQAGAAAVTPRISVRPPVTKLITATRTSNLIDYLFFYDLSALDIHYWLFG